MGTADDGLIAKRGGGGGGRIHRPSLSSHIHSGDGGSDRLGTAL